MSATTILQFLGGLVFLVVGAELLVRGAARLAATAGISPLVVGLTVVAFGTSSPEIAASVAASWQGQGDIAFGNVIGSNIFNVLFILGISALIAPLVVAHQLVRIDVPIMIIASLAMTALALDGQLGRLDGALLAAGLGAYILFTIRTVTRSRGAGEADEAPEEVRGGRAIVMNVALVVVGLVVLVIGARWLVAGAVSVARLLGVSELVIGLTIIAAGTSLPEVAASIIAAVRGQRDIAVGNVVGSNIFNLLCVFGISALVAPDGVPAARAAMLFDVPIMLAACVVCLPIFFTGHRIDRWEGALFLGFYAAYVAFVILAASRHDALEGFSWVMTAFVMPLTAVTLAVITFRALRARPSSG
jgi:cation:H+ antiporter